MGNEPAAVPAQRPQPGADPGDRAAQIGIAHAAAARLRDRHAAGLALCPTGEWPDRQRAALNAVRALAAFLTHHPTDPVAQALLAGGSDPLTGTPAGQAPAAPISTGRSRRAAGAPADAALPFDQVGRE